MQISFPGDRVIELGGGAYPRFRPNVDVRQCQNDKGEQTVDFTADFNEPLPITSDEWDGVYAQFVIEHLSWRTVKQFVAEVLRILKPGGKALFITANTEAQLKYIQDHPTGWEKFEGKPFESFSCILFGDNDYPENSHRNFMSPTIAVQLFQEAGFEKVEIYGFGGEIQTDMVIEAIKPAGQVKLVDFVPAVVGGPYAPDKLFNKAYFNGGGYRPFYWDYPWYATVARNVLMRKPESVFELGCGRGYVLKRLQDAGIHAAGCDVSKHCYMTRVCEQIAQNDFTKGFPIGAERMDLCLSLGVLETIPEDRLAVIFAEMERTCKRGLHGITFEQDSDDRTRCTFRPREWWIEKLPRGHEVMARTELEQSGGFPQDVLKGDGKLKVNVGCYMTQFHHGWTNLDIADLTGFAQSNGYNFQKHDARQGMPFNTESVDLLYHSHFLEHLTYAEGLKFLRECRRIIRPTGAMRIIVPDAGMLVRSVKYTKGNRIDDVDDQTPWTKLEVFDEINDGCASAKTAIGKLWSLLCEGHQAAYDYDTLAEMLDQSGWVGRHMQFRQFIPECEQIGRETLDCLPCLSLYVDALPITG